MKKWIATLLVVCGCVNAHVVTAQLSSASFFTGAGLANVANATPVDIPMQREQTFAELSSGYNGIHIIVPVVSFYSDTACTQPIRTVNLYGNVIPWDSGRTINGDTGSVGPDLHFYTSAIDAAAALAPGFTSGGASSAYSATECVKVRMVFVNSDVSNYQNSDFHFIATQSGDITFSGNGLVNDNVMQATSVSSSSPIQFVPRAHVVIGARQYERIPSTLSFDFDLTNKGYASAATIDYNGNIDQYGQFTNDCNDDLAPGASCTISTDGSEENPIQLGKGILNITFNDGAQPQTSHTLFDIYSSAGASYGLAWGDNTNNKVGDGITIGSEVLTPANVAFAEVDKQLVKQIISGSASSCALLSTSSGQVRCWGQQQYGALGNDQSSSGVVSTPTPVVSASGSGELDNIMQIGVGNNFACALNTDGQVYCWGRNNLGQLGDDSNIDSAIPKLVQFTVPGSQGTSPLANIAQIAVGSDHVCALGSNGTILCWGNNSNGQLGIGINTDGFDNSNTAMAVAGFPIESNDYSLGPIEVSAGGAHSCAVMSNGTAKCWGANTYGQLGIGADASPDDVLVPTTVVATDEDIGGTPLSKVVSISAGQDSTCAMVTNSNDTNTEARCWGKNEKGEVGAGVTKTAGEYITPQTVVGVDTGSLDNVYDIAVGNQGACAFFEYEPLVGSSIKTIGCWGDNSKGQLGISNLSPTESYTPRLIGGTGIDGILGLGYGSDSQTMCALSNSEM